MIGKNYHQALGSLNKETGLNDRLTRWAVALVFDIDIEYVKGSDNTAAEYLSRPNQLEGKW